MPIQNHIEFVCDYCQQGEVYPAPKYLAKKGYENAGGIVKSQTCFCNKVCLKEYNKANNTSLEIPEEAK